MAPIRFEASTSSDLPTPALRWTRPETSEENPDAEAVGSARHDADCGFPISSICSDLSQLPDATKDECERTYAHHS